RAHGDVVPSSVPRGAVGVVRRRSRVRPALGVRARVDRRARLGGAGAAGPDGAVRARGVAGREHPDGSIPPPPGTRTPLARGGFDGRDPGRPARSRHPRRVHRLTRGDRSGGAEMTTRADQVRTAQPRTSLEHIELVERTTPHNYHPLSVVVAEAEGCWVTDVEGRRYLDMLAAYSALNFGHRHPDLIAAAKEQLDRVTLTSRAFHHDQMGPFLRDLTELCGMDLALLMNSGAEAVETAIKTARKWGYEVKGVAPDRAKVIVAGGNFHGRTITIVSFSTDEASRRNFGPLTPGFEVVPYGDAAALEAAIDEDTVAFLVEPIQ